ncbi:O-antigen ligase family protein [Mucilaginibacter psychrotolerans]|uniref:O-antigen ligase-related domain-containing protein n=1 Tax=Mucilaginibacter psychrotolerans TaxID=1524096 RepID=A0A4Y8SC20_9SPHI|nr:O-antigen ligase family protein [Mucilaginibacter psychrotolerans]TFF36137.1 hypothetical protein E2R66_16460 [Mucilaginibacter psychrotolerans]
MQPILQKANLCILIAIYCLLPLLVADELRDPTETGKSLGFILCMVVLSGIYIGVICLRTLVVTFNQIDLCFLMILLWIVINRYVLASQQNFSIRFYELLALSALYVILRSLKVDHYIFLYVAILAGATIQGFIGNLQLYGFEESHHNLFPVTGSFFNPGPFAGYLASCFPLGFGIFLNKKKYPITLNANLGGLKMTLNPVYFLALCAIVSMVLILPVAESRASWLAIASACIFLAYPHFKRNRFFKKYSRSWIKILIMLIASGFLVLLIVKIYSFKQASSEGRLFVWKITLNEIAANPFLGVGFDKFESQYMDFQADYFKYHPNDRSAILSAGDVEYAFNEFLQFLVENGVIGVLFLVALIYFFIRRLDLKNEISRLAVAGIISCTVFSFFSYPSHILPIKMNAVCYLALLATVSPAKPVAYSVKKNVVVASSFFFLILGIGVLIFLNKVYTSFNNWYIANDKYQTTQYEESLKSYEKGYPTLSEDGTFLTEYGKALSMTKHFKKALYVLHKAEQINNSTIVQLAIGDSYMGMKQYAKAEQSYHTAWLMVPGRFYPKYLLVKLYLESGQNAKAVTVARELLTKEIRIKSPAIKQMLREMKKLTAETGYK